MEIKEWQTDLYHHKISGKKDSFTTAKTNEFWNESDTFTPKTNLGLLQHFWSDTHPQQIQHLIVQLPSLVDIPNIDNVQFFQNKQLQKNTETQLRQKRCSIQEQQNQNIHFLSDNEDKITFPKLTEFEQQDDKQTTKTKFSKMIQKIRNNWINQKEFQQDIVDVEFQDDLKETYKFLDYSLKVVKDKEFNQFCCE